MTKLFKKPPKEFTVNDQTVHISTLDLSVLVSLKGLKKPLSQAFAKFKNVGVNDYEEVTHTTPKPTEKDPDAIELISKKSHSAPSPAAVTQMVSNRAQGIEAICDCLMQENLLADILITSVQELNDAKQEDLFNKDSDYCLDLPTTLELLGCIMEVNAGSFEKLGKYWSPLKDLLGTQAP